MLRVGQALPISTKGRGLELALCEQAHSDLTGSAIRFGVSRGDPQAMADKIFINYRREDLIGTAGRLHDRLAQAFGRRKLFMDVDNIPAGVDFVADLNSQVAACRVFLAVIGPNWLDAKDESGGAGSTIRTTSWRSKSRRRLPATFVSSRF